MLPLPARAIPSKFSTPLIFLVIYLPTPSVPGQVFLARVYSLGQCVLKANLEVPHSTPTYQAQWHVRSAPDFIDVLSCMMFRAKSTLQMTRPPPANGEYRTKGTENDEEANVKILSVRTERVGSSRAHHCWVSALGYA